MGEENVGGLEVAMCHLVAVHGPQALQNMNYGPPNELFWEALLHLILTGSSVNIALQVAFFGVLHQQTQAVGLLGEERAMVGNDKGRADGSKQAHFIEGKIFFGHGELVHADLLEGEQLAVCLPFDEADSAEAALAEFLDGLKIFLRVEVRI